MGQASAWRCFRLKSGMLLDAKQPGSRKVITFMKKLEFGFYLEPRPIKAGSIRISPLPDFDSIVAPMPDWEDIKNDWIYASPQQTRDFMSNTVREQPYSSRVFGLPKTHMIEHATATDDKHLDFIIWALSFFVGMRLTTTERGFLDATPVKPGKLVDFVLLGQSLERAVELAEIFWMTNRREPCNAKRFEAAVHALFLAQYPQALQFERFIYLYTAIDACYALTKALRCPQGHHRHYERIEWMCGELGGTTPTWADPKVKGGTQVSDIRNHSLHEALFMDAPLGFAVLQSGTLGNLTLEMTALVCRLLVALIGGNDTSYLGSPVNTRQRCGLDLS